MIFTSKAKHNQVLNVLHTIKTMRSASMNYMETEHYLKNIDIKKLLEEAYSYQEQEEKTLDEPKGFFYPKEPLEAFKSLKDICTTIDNKDLRNIKNALFFDSYNRIVYKLD